MDLPIQKQNVDVRLLIEAFRDPVLPLHFARKYESHWEVGNCDQLVDLVFQHILEFRLWFALDAHDKRLNPFPNIFLFCTPIDIDERDSIYFLRKFSVYQWFGNRRPFFQGVRCERQDTDREGNE